MIFAIDPGPEKSAWLVYDSGKIHKFGIDPNRVVRDIVQEFALNSTSNNVVAIEQIRSYGKRVGNKTFDTCEWAGRFAQVAEDAMAQSFGAVKLIPRPDVKLIVCLNNTARDSDVRDALVYRYGGESAVGTKKTPGPLYGIVKDLWAALAVAVAVEELSKRGKKHG